MNLLLRILCVLSALAFATSVQAATWAVTKTADTNDGSCTAVDCSLREAVAAAVSGDTIVFASPLFDTARTITLTLGTEITIASKDLKITGPGADKLTIDGGAGANRIFHMRSGFVTLSGMKLTGGNGGGSDSYLDGCGGAIFALNAGLTLDGVHVTGNSAARGGGVYLEGLRDKVVRYSTFSDNTASDSGAAIFADSHGGTLTIVNTTVSRNFAAQAAAIFHTGDSDMVIVNSTITRNIGNVVGGIHAGAMVSLKSTVVAGNFGARPEIHRVSLLYSEGYNLIGDSAGDSANTNEPISYQMTDIRDTDPQLYTLAHNAGPTPVHMPAATSPVVDKGYPYGDEPDQRGAARTYDNPSVENSFGGFGTDIGSVELRAAPGTNVQLSGRATTESGRPVGYAEIVVHGGGVTYRVLTSPFGFYKVTGAKAGVTYSITAVARRHQFSVASALTVTPGDNLTGLDFVADF